MVALLSEYVSITDVVMIGTLIAVGLLTFRTQRPRILKEENLALSEENKDLREKEKQWLHEKAELLAQVKALESRIGILESKDTERLYDLMKLHDERVSEISQGIATQNQEMLKATTELAEHVFEATKDQREFHEAALPLLKELKDHIEQRGL